MMKHQEVHLNYQKWSEKGGFNMTNDKIILYICKEALEDIVVFNDIYPNWHELIRGKHAVLCIDVSDEEMDKIWNENNDIYIFCHGNDIETPITLVSFFKDIMEDYSLVAEKPRSLFVLNADKDLMAQVQKDYGVIVQSKDCIDDDIIFSLKHFRELTKGDVIGGEKSGWSNLIGNKITVPSNAIIISDNYLFANNHNAGADNLIKLVDAILPPELKIPFHVLIISKSPDISEKRVNQLAGNIKTEITKLRDFNIQIEFVFTDTIHKRKLFSNYYSITCDKGFVMFYLDRDTIVKDDDTDFDLMSIFYGIKNHAGDSEYCSSSKRMDDIKKICTTLKEQINGGVEDHTKKIIGDCNKDKSINNRLLQSI